MTQLSVWWGDRIAGTLRRGDDETLWFRYAESATNRDRISVPLLVGPTRDLPCTLSVPLCHGLRPSDVPWQETVPESR